MSAGMCVIIGLWVALFLPETNGVKMSSMLMLFQSHWFWGKLPAIANMSAVSNLPDNTDADTDGLVLGAARLSA